MSFNNELSSFLKEEYKKMCEGLDSSSNMINTNLVNPEEMGAVTNAPGEFSMDEITDKKNLENTAKMSNDNNDKSDNLVTAMSITVTDEECPVTNEDEHGPECDCPDCEKHSMIDISEPEHEDKEEDNSIKGIFSKMFGENTSETAKALREAIDEVVGTDYAGPLDFNADIRISATDVLNTLKKEIGKGSEGIHVDRENASNGKYEYKITQVDEKLLPKKIKVGRQELILKDGSYISSEMIEEQPK